MLVGKVGFQQVLKGPDTSVCQILPKEWAKPKKNHFLQQGWLNPSLGGKLAAVFFPLLHG